MECNKDEALRAKDLAETKLLQKDIMGAQKLAIKAQNLFPSLEGLSQLIAVLDVYVCAEKRINGEVDLYRVLGVDPLADYETIKKNYRKLAPNLHPDKNKSVGAEGAFKIVSEAWSLLSDKDKKAKYDLKRNLRATYEKVTQNFSTPAGKNGFHSSVVPQVYPPRPSKPNTFWTSCVRCFMLYEYQRDYLHKRLLCPNCRQPFLAVEIRNPSGNPNTSTGGSSNMQHQNSNHHAANNSAGQPSSVTFQQGQPSKSSTGGSDVKLKRGCEAETNACGEGAFQIKKKVNGSAKKRRVDEQKPNSTRELSQSETRVLLMSKARNEILKKLDEWNFVSKKEVERVQTDNSDAPNVDIKKANVSGVRKGGDLNCSSQPKHSSKPSVEPPVFMSMAVPDPDFHDFDKDRTEKSFGENEVWAAYDDDDGMPRIYALIHRVISKRPFIMNMSWLNSKSNAELGPINWVGSGFRKTCGNYYIGKHEVNHTLNAFSHKVKFMRSKGVIQIFPAKEDVWALYKNWTPYWNEHTAEDLVHKYEMVLVLEDYTEEKGIIVLPLVKVSGFKSVFHQQLDLKEARKIPKEEIFRFSHQVPSYLLTGEEAENVPKGCLDLDPAGLPSELLQVITQDKSVENVENAQEELPEISKKPEVKRVITYSRRTVGKKAGEGKGEEGVGAAKVMMEKKVVGSG